MSDGVINGGSAARRQVSQRSVLFLVCLGQFMVILDIAIVNVALPSIRNELGFSTTSLQWVINAYTLSFAGFLLLGGRAADLFGRRRLFLIGLGLFSLGSLAGGLSQNQAELVTARAFQGLGGAVLSPATLTILLTLFTDSRERAKALGVWSAVAAAGGASGALLGGIFTDLLGWRWILLINVPVGIVVFLRARLILPESRGDTNRRHLDFLGAITVTAGLVAVVWGIVRSESLGWGAREVLISLFAGVALLFFFVLVEMRISRAPIVPLRIFRSRSVSGANLVMFGVVSAFFPNWYFLTLYLQNVRGESPLVAGLAFVPQTLAIVIGSQLSARLLPKIGPRPLLIAGPLVSAAGFLWLAQLTVSSSVIWGIVLPASVVTLGAGLVFPAVAMAATAGVAPSETGLASGVVNTTRQMGASLGLAALITVAADHTAGLKTAGTTAAANLTAGWAVAIAVAAAIAVACSLLALIVPGRPAVARIDDAVQLGGRRQNVPVPLRDGEPDRV